MKSLERTNELFPGFKSLLEAKNYVEITICCGELELVVSCLDSPTMMLKNSKDIRPVAIMKM
jgi:hypothetical protein